MDKRSRIKELARLREESIEAERRRPERRTITDWFQRITGLDQVSDY